MTILLRWLIDHVWLFYVGCAIGALIYLVRALAAQREQSLAMFTLEHEAATARAVRAWAMVFLFVAVCLTIFIGTRFVIASFPAYDPTLPVPTSTPSSGVNPPTPSATSTPTDTLTLPTLPAETATSPAPPPDATEPAAPTESPSPTPTATPVAQGPLSGSLAVRFGDFGQLVGWELSTAQVVVGQPFQLTLYWQGLEGEAPTDYTVFTHLLSDGGQLIAQHDGPPAGGAETTSDWEAGETIRDTHQLTFISGAEDRTGAATLIVGLYDPADINARLMTSEGQDYVELPVTINVIPE